MGREGLPFSFSRAGEVRYVTARRALDRVIMPGARIRRRFARRHVQLPVRGGESGHRRRSGSDNLRPNTPATCDNHLDLKPVTRPRGPELSDDSYDVVLLIRRSRTTEPQELARVLAEAVRVTRRRTRRDLPQPRHDPDHPDDQESGLVASRLRPRNPRSHGFRLRRPHARRSPRFGASRSRSSGNCPRTAMPRSLKNT